MQLLVCFPGCVCKTVCLSENKGEDILDRVVACLIMVHRAGAQSCLELPGVSVCKLRK